MSIKITLVENHINRNFKQYNIDEFTIKENFGSIENFKTILSNKRSKEDEANLIAFLNEIRPINKIIDMRKNNHQTTIHKGYVSSANWLIKKFIFKFLNVLINASRFIQLIEFSNFQMTIFLDLTSSILLFPYLKM